MSEHKPFDLPHLEWVTGADHAWMRMDSPENLMIINAVLILEPLSYEALKQATLHRLLIFPRFRQRVVEYLGVHYWQDDADFQVENHLQEIVLDSGTDTEDQLHRLIDREVAMPLPDDRPLWKLYLIQGSDKGSVVLFRVHHSYADGISLIKVFDRLTATERAESLQPLDDADEKTGSPGRNVVDYPLPGYQKWMDKLVGLSGQAGQLGKRVLHQGQTLVKSPDKAVRLAKNALHALGEISRLTVMPADNARSLKPRLTSKKRCAWSAQVSLDQIKQIGHELNVKVNDVLLAIVTSGMRRFLLECGEDVNGKTIHVAVPVNLRGRGLSDPAEALGNRFGMIFVPLPVGVASPLERIYTIKKDTEALKHSPQPVVSYGMLYGAGFLPESLQKSVLDLYGSKVSAVLSNVPGTHEYRYLAGKKVLQQLFWVPQAGAVGMGISMVSYAGNVQFGLLCDRGICASPEQIMTYCLEELATYQTLCDRLATMPTGH